MTSNSAMELTLAGARAAHRQGRWTDQTMPLSDYARDTFVAPSMSRFTSAEMPDMSAFDEQQER